MSPTPPATGADDVTASSGPGSILTRFLPTLTTTSHVSAAVFSTFLFVHLAAPLAASAKAVLNVSTHPLDVLSGAGQLGGAAAVAEGCNDVASRWMLLGRVYYQTALSEPIVVWGAAAVHVAASICKTAIRRWDAHLRRRRRQRQQRMQRTAGDPSQTLPTQAESEPKSSTLETSPRLQLQWPALPSSHALSAWALMPLLLLHTALHRLVPASAEYPISSLSPSELDYSIVHYGLSPSSRVLPRIGARVLYGLALVGLVGSAAVHGSQGAAIIGKRAVFASRKRRSKARDAEAAVRASSSAGPSEPNVKSNPRSSKRRQSSLPVVLASLLVLVGTCAIAIDPELAPRGGSAGSHAATPLSWTEKRYRAVFASVWPFSLSMLR